MRRLEKHEIADLKVRFAQWQTPGQMHDLYEATNDTLGSVNLFNQGGLAFLRDASIASEFGKARQAEKVRLVADTWPDLELLIDGRVEAFEAVEADRPGRERGREFREDDGEVEFSSIEEWIAEADQAPAWLEAACRTKANKNYGSRASLVIYLNLNEWGVRHAQVVSCFPHATRAAQDYFDAVWILWKGRAYRVRRSPNEESAAA